MVLIVYFSALSISFSEGSILNKFSVEAGYSFFQNNDMTGYSGNIGTVVYQSSELKHSNSFMMVGFNPSKDFRLSIGIGLPAIDCHYQEYYNRYIDSSNIKLINDIKQKPNKYSCIAKIDNNIPLSDKYYLSLSQNFEYFETNNHNTSKILVISDLVFYYLEDYSQGKFFLFESDLKLNRKMENFIINIGASFFYLNYLIDKSDFYYRDQYLVNVPPYWYSISPGSGINYSFDFGFEYNFLEHFSLFANFAQSEKFLFSGGLRYNF